MCTYLRNIVFIFIIFNTILCPFDFYFRSTTLFDINHILYCFHFRFARACTSDQGVISLARFSPMHKIGEWKLPISIRIVTRNFIFCHGPSASVHVFFFFFYRRRFKKKLILKKKKSKPINTTRIKRNEENDFAFRAPTTTFTARGRLIYRFARNSIKQTIVYSYVLRKSFQDTNPAAQQL